MAQDPPALPDQGRPDPTILTTEALQREVATLEERDTRLAAEIHREISLVQREFEARKETRQREHATLEQLVVSKIEVLNERLRGIDRATELLKETVNRTPTEVTKEMTHLRDVQDEKFRSIGNQFAERDVRTDQATRSSGEALAAALQAAKELVGAQGEASAAAAVKAEVSTAKQIDQLVVIISTLEKSINDRITELKERIDRGEGTDQGISANKSGMYALAGFILTALLIVNLLAANGVLGGK